MDETWLASYDAPESYQDNISQIPKMMTDSDNMLTAIITVD